MQNFLDFHMFLDTIWTDTYIVQDQIIEKTSLWIKNNESVLERNTL